MRFTGISVAEAAQSCVLAALMAGSCRRSPLQQDGLETALSGGLTCWETALSGGFGLSLCPAIPLGRCVGSRGGERGWETPLHPLLCRRAAPWKAMDEPPRGAASARTVGCARHRCVARRWQQKPGLAELPACHQPGPRSAMAGTRLH